MPVPSFLSMYQQLVASPSISSLDPQWDHSNKGVIDLLTEWLQLLGFHCEVNELQGKPGKYNLLARRGEGSGGLLLSGHTDTVPYDANRWNFDPFKLTEQNNRWYGLGSIDMKGFFAFVIEALKALPAEQQKQPLMILATADEETTMAGARALRAEQYSVVIGDAAQRAAVAEHCTGRGEHSSERRVSYYKAWAGAVDNLKLSIDV